MRNASRRFFESNKIRAVMSLPRLGFNASWASIQAVLVPLGIPLAPFYGAFWEQTMQRAFSVMCERECDWILAIDYDSLFLPRHLEQMAGRLWEHREIDALAPLQVRRGLSVPLHCPDYPDERRELFVVETANFGLTFIRTSALRKLPKPWFQTLPGPEGEFEDGTDADIYFWNRWREAGNSLYVDRKADIGHLEMVVAHFDDQMQAKRSLIDEWSQQTIKGS